jgi:hypothetical protein
MIRPSVLITRLLAATVAASAMLVVFSSQALAMRPDPGDGAVPGSPVPATAPSTSSDPMLWIILAIAVIAIALVAAAVLRVRQRPLVRHSQTSPAA